jgi:hypothetical protein
MNFSSSILILITEIFKFEFRGANSYFEPNWIWDDLEIRFRHLNFEIIYEGMFREWGIQGREFKRGGTFYDYFKQEYLLPEQIE